MSPFHEHGALNDHLGNNLMGGMSGGGGSSMFHSNGNGNNGEPNSLSSDLGQLLNNPARSDVTFMVEGRPIYAHRCILMCRCKGFGQLDEVLNVFFRDDLFFLFLLSLHR